MGTRGCIARLTKEGFSGVYHHWDSYPSGLGQILWELYHEHFKEDLKAMLTTLIDQHPAGWSTICCKDFNLRAGFLEMDSPKYKTSKQPQCYCHGSRKEKAWIVTQANASDSGVEWTYAFNEQNNSMQIMKSFNEDDTSMIGTFGCGNPKATWRTVKTVALHEKEPDWKEIETDVHVESDKIYKAKEEKETKKVIEETRELLKNPIIAQFNTTMATTFYQMFWKECGTKGLTLAEKLSALKQLSNLSLKEPYWKLGETDTIDGKTLSEMFPDLIPNRLCALINHRHLSKLSGLLLYTIHMELFRELKTLAENGKLTTGQIEGLQQ
jgi:hypothetical protein